MDMEQNEQESQQESQLTVALLEFGSSKQQLKLTDCSFAAVVVEVEKALGLLGMDISVLCAGKSPTGSKDTYILQIWSNRWNSFVDVSKDDVIRDGHRLTVSQISKKEVSSRI